MAVRATIGKLNEQLVSSEEKRTEQAEDRQEDAVAQRKSTFTLFHIEFMELIFLAFKMYLLGGKLI